MTEDRGRAQLNIRLERGLLDELDQAAREEQTDKADLARRLLADGLRAYRMDHAISDYRDGRATAWAAADRAGVSLYELLDRLHAADIPYRLDPEVLERLRAGRRSPPPGSGRRQPDPRVPRRSEPDVERLRGRYRPERVRLLLVGESSPSGGTHFYRANSNLFRATREALRRATGIGEVPEGAGFLEWFQSLGFWLVDLAEEPIDDLPADERAAAVAAGVPRLARVIRNTAPERIVGVKTSIGPNLWDAVRQAGVDEGMVDVLPFPLYQWRNAYVERLAAIVRQVLDRSDAGEAGGPPPDSSHRVAEEPAGYGTHDLQDAMAIVLRDRGNAWTSAASIALEIARRGLWRRPSDGAFPEPRQIRAWAGRYPQLFQKSDRGLRLRGS